MGNVILTILQSALAVPDCSNLFPNKLNYESWLDHLSEPLLAPFDIFDSYLNSVFKKTYFLIYMVSHD